MSCDHHLIRVVAAIICGAAGQDHDGKVTLASLYAMHGLQHLQYESERESSTDQY